MHGAQSTAAGPGPPSSMHVAHLGGRDLSLEDLLLFLNYPPCLSLRFQPQLDESLLLIAQQAPEDEREVGPS
jgi:hypothetical protein